MKTATDSAAASRALLAGAASEKDFQAAVVEYAQLRGWLLMHPYDSRRSARGYPDLTMTRHGRLVFAELKTAKGRLAADQHVWMTALGLVEMVNPNVQTFVWRPSDWPEIEAVLR